MSISFHIEYSIISLILVLIACKYIFYYRRFCSDSASHQINLRRRSTYPLKYLHGPTADDLLFARATNINFLYRNVIIDLKDDHRKSKIKAFLLKKIFDTTKTCTYCIDFACNVCRYTGYLCWVYKNLDLSLEN